MNRMLTVTCGAMVAGSALADGGVSWTKAWEAPLNVPATFATRELATTYSNDTNFLGVSYTNGLATETSTLMAADDISRVGADQEDLQEFFFTISNFNTVEVAPRVHVEFYGADGALGAPGQYLGGYLLDKLPAAANKVSGWFISVSESSLTLPKNFWVGVWFDSVGTNLTAAQLNQLGQGVFNPPTIGSSENKNFTSTSSSGLDGDNPAGSLMFPTAFHGSFGWSFGTVPTPGAFTVLGFGGLALGRRRR